MDRKSLRLKNSAGVIHQGLLRIIFFQPSNYNIHLLAATFWVFVFFVDRSSIKVLEIKSGNNM
jgi:hypothetical protein